MSEPDPKDRSVLVRWLGCVARGRHEFNETDICLDCGAERGGPSIVDVARSEANQRSGRTA